MSAGLQLWRDSERPDDQDADADLLALLKTAWAAHAEHERLFALWQTDGTYSELFQSVNKAFLQRQATHEELYAACDKRWKEETP